LEFSPKRVLEAITTLQYCGLLDLHGSRDGWFYRVRSTEEPRCRDWLRAAGME
jgi:hypothetical protein